MSFFGVETNRLVRTKWRDTDPFAQEVYALLQGDLPITQNAPVRIAPDPRSKVPPLTIDWPENSDVPPIRIVRDGVNIDIGGTGGDGGNTGSGGQDLGEIDWPGSDPATIALAVPDPADSPVTLYGEVVAKVDGTTYTVAVWAKSPLTSPRLGVLSVRFPGTDPDDEIPAGFGCPVIVFPGADGLGNRVVLDAVSFVPIFAPRPP